MPNPITTATIPTTAAPVLMLTRTQPDGPITYASINCDPDSAIQMLNYAVLHLLATRHGLATIPAAPAIAVNGNGHQPAETLPATVSNSAFHPADLRNPARKKPGPKPKRPLDGYDAD